MLSSTRSIYKQTFADPGNILLRKSSALNLTSSEKSIEKEKMLLIQPRKRSRATSDGNNHATSHPASWQATAQKDPLDAQPSVNAGPFESASLTQSSPRPFSETAIADLSLEQLQNLHVLVEERIQIKKRYNSTPLRRIIARQVSRHASSSTAPTTVQPDSDTASETDTLVNSSTPNNIVSDREPLEVRRERYNDTPLRRILSRQASGAYAEEHGHPPHVPNASFEAEPQEVRRARYNNTPLRRIVSRQIPSSPSSSSSSRTFLPPSICTSTPVPRSNTPLRRILSRQVSAQTVPQKEDDDACERADSVIDPDSPVRSRTTAQTTSVILNGEARIRNWEEAVWNKTPILSGFSEEKEQEKGTTVTVTEVVAETKMPTRIVVDAKGSPLRRILQR